ncbi:MAG: UDP-2,3-diacylglucosamine diphosphatase [Saprospiraceae bacterium]
MSNTYFASDFHLGIEASKSSKERELLICNWLDEIAPLANRIYLLGDMFDFWFEYRHAVPKGFVRLLGKLGEMTDSGIQIQVFTGNHDLWMWNYFKDELGIQVHHHSIIEVINGKKFFLAHGDGLGPDDYSYKRMKKLFTHPFSKALYRFLHPDIGIPLANYFSGRSRNTQQTVKKYLGHDKEWLIQYVERKSKEIDIDYFVFGHRHLPIDYTLSNQNSRYINLGDWLVHQSYAIFDGEEMKLCFYKNDETTIYH